MSYLRYLTIGLSVTGLALTQLTGILPDGRIKTYALIASAFLAGLPINLFKPAPTKQLGMFDVTPTAKTGR